MAEQTEGSGPSELELLKDRARLLGVEFSNNIGIDTLRERVNAKIALVEGAASNEAEEEESFEEGEEEEEVIEEEEQQQEPAQAPQANGLLAAAAVAASKTSITPVQAAPAVEPVIEDDGPTVSRSQGNPTRVREGRTPTLRQYMYNEQMKLVRVRIQNLDPKKADLNGEMLCVANKYIGNIKMFVPYGEVTDDGWHIPNIIYKELARRRFLHIREVKDPKTKQPVIKKAWAKEFAIEILPPLTEGELKSLAIAQLAAGSIDSDNNDLV